MMQHLVVKLVFGHILNLINKIVIVFKTII